MGRNAARQARALVCGICGQPVQGEFIRYDSGPVYHRDCHARAPRCGICNLPIGKHQKALRDKTGNVYHSGCYETAAFCTGCGNPITAGQSYRQAKGSNEKWHAACFNNATFCGLTGKHIRPGSQTVKIGSEIFLKAAYDQAPKCLVSALPIPNHGRYLVNRRTRTHVLERYKDHTHQCYSCGDWLAEGYFLGDSAFLCNHCYHHAVQSKDQAAPHLKAAAAFFAGKGIDFPANIEINVLPPGVLVQGQRNTDMKGACQTRVAVFGPRHVYTHHIEILYGLNAERFAAVLVHELSHAVIAEHMKYKDGREAPVPHEEGRCEYAAYRFAQENNLPDYLLATFAANRVDEYREGFLYYQQRNPESLKAVLTEK